MLKCECGGELKSVTLDQDFDFTPFAGLPTTIAKESRTRGLRCTRCRGETLPGRAIDELLASLAATVIGLPHRLGGAHFRFLRGHLGLTQQELAERMGLGRRETVAEYENGRHPVSPQSDFILRALTYRRLAGDWPGAETLLLPAIERVRTAAPRAPAPIAVRNLLGRLRGGVDTRRRR